MQDRFPTRKSAYTWLINQGAKVSVGKFYQDAAAGEVLVYPDGTVGQASVAEYMLSLKSPAPTHNTVHLAQEKARLEVRKLELEVSRKELENRREDKNWIQTDDHWAHLAATLAHLKGLLEHFGRQAGEEIVSLCDAEYRLIAEVGDRVVEAVVNRSFNELCLMKITEGVFAKEEEANEL